MIKSKLVDGKVFLMREADDRKPLLQRLVRIEGQIRGIKAMIENDRYCGDELHQVKAATAALRAFAAVLAEQHIVASSQLASSGRKDASVRADLLRILGHALRM